MNSFERVICAFENAGCVVDRDTTGRRASIQAPGHSAKDRSVSLLYSRDRTLIYSFADDRDEVLANVGLSMRDLFDDPRGVTYGYPGGRVVQRTPDKRFPQSGNKSDLSLYRADRLPHDLTIDVYVTEGEQCADALAELNVPAVSPPQGASTPASRFDWTPLSGRRIRIVADKDPQGRTHARDVAAMLEGLAVSATIVEAKVGKDAADHVTAGYGVGEFVPQTIELTPDTDTEFWSQREVLGHIRDFARARRASPWATLGVVLARAVAAVEPNVMIPPYIGGAVSLNLFVAAVGSSGGGKGAADGAGLAAVTFVDHVGRSIEIDQPNIGSGEGLARAFCSPDTDDRESSRRTRALIGVSEIDTLAALAGRRGATLMPELRKAYMGESIGFNNASKATTSAVEAHSYRLCLTVGVQPENAAALIDDAKGGTPQRFVWLPVNDPDAPDVRPPEPEPWTVKFVRWDSTAQHLEIPDQARYEIDAHRLQVLRGNNVDPLDGHVMLCRLKVAAALMLLDGRSVVDDDDWRLAGEVMAVSRRTRSRIEQTLSERHRIQRRTRAVARGEDEDTAEASKMERRLQRIGRRILRELESGKEVSRGPLRRCLNSADRVDFDPAITHLIEAELVVVRTAGSDEWYHLRR
ncbi:hypothetical protein QLG13_08170 [Rhodococcus aetherivorans]|uniref:hypothetical protein n=1 Tax=Rhodococcus aetherivorans TaxID=191292 RepID=UPI0003A8DB10|nr:hypothetical protein [Rhodococcus aetherivorans]